MPMIEDKRNWAENRIVGRYGEYSYVVVPAGRLGEIRGKPEEGKGGVEVGVFSVDWEKLVDSGHVVMFRCRDDCAEKFGREGIAYINENGETLLISNSFVASSLSRYSGLKRVYDTFFVKDVCRRYWQECLRVVRDLLNRYLSQVIEDVGGSLYVRWINDQDRMVFTLHQRITRNPRYLTNSSRSKYFAQCRRVYSSVLREFYSVLQKNNVPVKRLRLYSFEEVASFSAESDVRYIFHGNRDGAGPLALYIYGPYALKRSQVKVLVLYEKDSDKKGFIEALKRSFPNLAVVPKDKNKISVSNKNGTLSFDFKFMRVESIYYKDHKYIRNIVDNHKDEYVVLLLTNKKLDDKIFGKLKWHSIGIGSEGRALSRLQISTKFAYPSKFIIGGLLSSLIYKDGGIPWFISVSEEPNRELENALIVGIAFAKVHGGYIRSIAVMMRADGTLISTLIKDFNVSRSMEFNRKEIDVFVKEIKDYINDLDFDPDKIIIMRTRRYKSDEINSFAKLFDKEFKGIFSRIRYRGKRQSFKVVFISLSREMQVPLASVNGNVKNDYVVKIGDRMLLYYNRKWLHPLVIRYSSYGGDVDDKEILTIIEVLRRYNFASMSKTSSFPAPLSYAMKMAKWKSWAGIGLKDDIGN